VIGLTPRTGRVLPLHQFSKVARGIDAVAFHAPFPRFHLQPAQQAIVAPTRAPLSSIATKKTNPILK
jgi:hypothetical protein